MEISKLFDLEYLITHITVLAYEEGDARLYYKIQVDFKDGSQLFAREYIQHQKEIMLSIGKINQKLY